jgi:two-component system alkaline phosphatase synthesis response regulator PhoP
MKKILVVDDEPDILRSIEEGLKSKGYEVITASDGEEALKKAREGKPDLITLDLMLPKIDGYKVFSILKAESDFVEVPVIMLTARGGTSDIKTGIEMDAAAYVTKPFKPAVLFGLIDALLKD